MFFNTPKIFVPLALAAAIAGCNGGSSSDTSETNASPTPVARTPVSLQPTFTATFKANVDHNANVNNAQNAQANKVMAMSYYEGSLTALNTTTGITETFDWPVTADETGKVVSEKTVTVEPGTYDFTLVVTKGSQQYTSVLTGEVIEDQREYRLNMDIFPVVGDTIINIDSVKNLSRLQFEFPANELASINAPQIGLVIDGIETIYELNTDTGIADIILNLPEGTHTYNVNLYDGNILIGRSKLGDQSLDLVQGDDLNIDIPSLQADITIDFGDNTQQPRFIINIPEDVVTNVGDISNLNLLVRITDGDQTQEVTLAVQEQDGQYFVEHIFDDITNEKVSTYIEFLDLTSGTAETIATCADSDDVVVHETNEMSCGIGIPKDYVIGGNLLATLSINVLDENKVAQASAEVFVDNELVGITGNNFGTPGFIKTYVKAGEVHTAVAKKDGLEDSHTLTPDPLSINNFDLILKKSYPGLDILGEGTTCKIILDSGESQGTGLYVLDIDGSGPLEEFVTWCDMDTKEGGWTLVRNNRAGRPVEVTTTLAGPMVREGVQDVDVDLIGAIPDPQWFKLKETTEEILFITKVGVQSGTYTSDPEFPLVAHTSIEKLNEAPACISWSDSISLSPVGEQFLFWYEPDCNTTGSDYTFIRGADVYVHGEYWLESHGASYQATGTAFYVK